MPLVTEVPQKSPSMSYTILRRPCVLARSVRALSNRIGHTTSAQEEPRQRRNHRGEHHGDDDRGPQRDCDCRRPYPEGLLVDREMAAFAEGPRDHQGGKQSGRKQPQHRDRPWGKLSAPASIGPAALMAALASVTATIETHSDLTKALPSSPTTTF
jgi:hypothetical protein